ncbi:hypothetical protein PM082_024206 [Marasmius tenuissimus]|nr:hypothetical protein PM082_024206 [Marasmius tenuissimus]
MKFMYNILMQLAVNLFAASVCISERGLQDTGLQSREDPARCKYQSPYGCDKGSCWKSCGSPGDGNWCWTAKGNGSVAEGDGSKPGWLGCNTYRDCNPKAACGKGDCTNCGCWCR